jgi:hypothetical protein
MIVGRLEQRYEQISFSGGGLRCFWQGGAIDELRTVLPLEPERITAASGGALAAACFISEQGPALMDAFHERLKEQDDNLHLEPAADLKQMTPHQQLYRDVVEDVLCDKACERIAQGPAFEVLLARPPRFLPKRVGAAVTMALYEADKLIRSNRTGAAHEHSRANEQFPWPSAQAGGLLFHAPPRSGLVEVNPARLLTTRGRILVSCAAA